MRARAGLRGKWAIEESYPFEPWRPPVRLALPDNALDLDYIAELIVGVRGQWGSGTADENIAPDSRLELYSTADTLFDTLPLQKTGFPSIPTVSTFPATIESRWESPPGSSYTIGTARVIVADQHGDVPIATHSNIGLTKPGSVTWTWIWTLEITNTDGSLDPFAGIGILKAMTIDSDSTVRQAWDEANTILDVQAVGGLPATALPCLGVTLASGAITWDFLAEINDAVHNWSTVRVRNGNIQYPLLFDDPVNYGIKPANSERAYSFTLTLS